MTVVIKGKEISEKILKNIKNIVDKNNLSPRLAIILTANNEAGKIYVKNKMKAADKSGITVDLIEYPENVTEKTLIDKVNDLNNSGDVDGILVQLPLPDDVNESVVLSAVSPQKDVDGFHYVNAGLLATSQEPYSIACTPKGIMTALKYHNIDVSGMNAVVIGRSNIVGKPIAQLLLKNNATVTVAHSKTKNLSDYTKNADLIVVAVGKPKFLTADMVKDGVIVIDVGISRVDGKVVGDVDFENVSKKASYITPVPKGVGPMTIASLAENTLSLHIKRHNILI